MAVLVLAATVAAAFPKAASADFLIGLTNQGRIVSFDSATPGSIVSSVSVSGLQGGDTSLLGIDYRPSNGRLYGLSNSRVYTIDFLTGVATLASTLSTAASGAAFGVDFNPVADRLRVVSDTGQNLRINVDTGAVTVDGAINPGGFTVAGSAYTNNFAGATSTTLFNLSIGPDQLSIQSPPNNGTQSSPVALTGVPFALSNLVGFDISGTGVAFAALTPSSTTPSTLFQINLTTGAATSLGTIGGGVALVGLAAPVPEPSSLALTGLGLAAGLAIVRRRRQRS